MELIIKRYEELTLEELYEILQARVAVFVVEQNCTYQELDGKDSTATHIYLRDCSGIKAYLRVFPNNSNPSEVFLGRVLSLKRKCGFAARLLMEGIRIAKENYRAEKITLQAQTYAKSLYEKAGFKQISEEFWEDGIPHIMMQLKLN